MKEIPILFSTPMVQALLDGSKTMTRRVLKVKGCKHFIPDNSWDFDTILKWNKDYYPYGKVGDVLWVRETWCLRTPYGPEDYYFGYKAGNSGIMIKASEKYDYKTPDINFPCIHMPKEACRLFLKVKSVRVERLQDITEQDAIDEGVFEYEDGTFKNYFKRKGLRAIDGVECLLPKGSFHSLWESINGLDSWDANPWVWVIKFERI